MAILFDILILTSDWKNKIKLINIRIYCTYTVKILKLLLCLVKMFYIPHNFSTIERSNQLTVIFILKNKGQTVFLNEISLSVYFLKQFIFHSEI